jgi:hypothetical protein
MRIEERARAHRSRKCVRADQFSQKEQSETKVMKIENGEQPILGLHANFELDRSVHVHIGAKKYARTTIFSKNCTIDQPENGI